MDTNTFVEDDTWDKDVQVMPRNPSHIVSSLPKTQSVLITKQSGHNHLSRTAILLKLTDLQSELKLEVRDHKITKEQLERQNKMHEEYSDKLQETLRNKLTELRT